MTRKQQFEALLERAAVELEWQLSLDCRSSRPSRREIIADAAELRALAALLKDAWEDYHEVYGCIQHDYVITLPEKE